MYTTLNGVALCKVSAKLWPSTPTMLARRLQQLRARSTLNAQTHLSLQVVRRVSGKSDTEDWSNLTNVVKV